MRPETKTKEIGWIAVRLAGAVLVMVARFMTMQSHARTKARASKIRCPSHMKQIGLALRLRSTDNQDQFPFNLSTNDGGTLELCLQDSEGFDSNAFLHFMVMSNEIGSPLNLVCTSDKSRKPAVDFQHLRPENITYKIRSGTNITEHNSNEIVAVCPMDGYTLFADGSIGLNSKR